MINNEPAQLDLLKKLQEATTEDVDEERGSFKKGDRVTYNMFGGGLTNSDIIRTLGTDEHTMRANHNETIAEIVEAIGEKVARYGIMFEDGFVISDVAASELKTVSEEEDEELSMEDRAEEYAVALLKKTSKSYVEVQKVLQRAYGFDVPKSEEIVSRALGKVGESKTNEAEEATDTMKPQEKPNIKAEDFHMEDLSDVDLEKAKGSSEESGNAIRQVKDDELKIEPDKVVTPKKESKLKEATLPSDKEIADLVSNVLSSSEDPIKQTGKLQNKLVTEFHLTVDQVKKIMPKVNLAIRTWKSTKESKLKEAKDVLVTITGGEDEGKPGLVSKWVKGLGYQDVSFEGKKKQISYEYLNVGDKSAEEYDKEVEVEESKLNEEETEFTPSRVEMKKIGDEQLRTLHGRALKSQEYWTKDRTAPEKAELAKQAVKRYEEELILRGLITGVEIPNEMKKLKYSFMKKQDPLWLCNECFNTFRSNGPICTLCESKEVEKIFEQGPGFTKEVFKVTWKNTDTGKEESTRVMAFDKADAKKEATRSNREVTKVEGPIKSVPEKEEDKAPFDESSEGSNLSELEGIVDGILQDKYPGMGVAEVLDALVSQYEGKLTDEERVKIKVYIKDVIDESKLKEDVQELVREVPGIDKEEQETLLKAIEDGTISNEWPTDEEMVDALTKAGVDSEIASDPEAEDFRVSYVKHFLLTKAIKAAKVAKESKIEEQEVEGVPEKGQTYSIHPTSGVNFPDGTYEVTDTSYRWTAQGDLAKHFRIAGDDRWWIAKFYGFKAVKESGVEEAKEVKPIRTIEIVRSQLDPEAYNIRVVELPEGSIEILDSVSDEKEAIKRGKEFARQLNAKFLGIIDEKKLKEQEANILKLSDEELEKLPIHVLGRARADAWRNYRLGSGSKEGMDWKESWRRLDNIIKKMGESKLKEQEEDTFTTVAKGFVDKADADRLAKEKEGQVIQDEEDETKFAVLARTEQ